MPFVDWRDNMQFPETYFEDEVREGFYISDLMKRAWAAQQEVLEIIQNVCEKYGIRYFAEWGTLLGIIRHGGRIPWDDDVDVCMLRPDYNRFCSVIADELPEECQFFAPEYTKGYQNQIARIINSRLHVVEGEALKRYHGFPYVAGVDIFCLDEVAGETGGITNLPVWEKNKRYWLRQTCYSEEVWLPYEQMMLAVPDGFEELLTRKYSCLWLRPLRTGGSHDYPSYAKQQRFLEKKNGGELFSYRYSPENREATTCRSGQRETFQTRIQELVPLFCESHVEIRRCVAAGCKEDAVQLLGECQNMAVQVGTMIEERYGSDHPTVKVLEKYCEMLWEMSSHLLDEGVSTGDE